MALRAPRSLEDHGLQAPLGHNSPQGECPIEISTMELTHTTSRPCRVHGPPIHRDTQLSSWSATCPPFNCIIVQEGMWLT